MAAARKKSSGKNRDQRMQWWREARFGLFIHWGLYALPAGTWKGQRIPGIGEWIMNRARIPVREYEQLAGRFDPVRFDADEWVKVARDAGMKYLVITAKHHDGFALFKSAASDYNIVDATPFGRDPIAELAIACRKAGIRLCFYYSQKQDWHHPDASGNSWDFPDGPGKDFNRYMRDKGLPQVRELLTQYGPIGLIWYDTPQDITPAQSRRFVRQVYDVQPDCLVDGRAGHGMGDYVSMGDNLIPPARVDGDWETPATLNDTWGYKSYDRNWKSADGLIRRLVDIVSKGGNYLLNVGPTAAGVIPAPSVARLRRIGDWLRVNGEAVHGAGPSPYPFEPGWGRMTTKKGKLYLHVFDWPGRELVLYGLQSKVTKARLLADTAGRALPVQQDLDADLPALRLTLPARAPDKRASVIVLSVRGEAEFVQTLVQDGDGGICLEAHNATVRETRGAPPLTRGRFGTLEGWSNTRTSAAWEFLVARPGRFEVQVVAQTEHGGDWKGGHRLKVSVGRRSVSGVLRQDEQRDNPRATADLRDVVSRLGAVEIPRAGRASLTLRPEKLARRKGFGLKLRAVQLVPVQE